MSIVKAFAALLKRLGLMGVSVKDVELVRQALAHRSYINENPGKVPGSNERMEFLGDAILGFLVSDHLYRLAPKGDEGDLSRRKAQLVSERSLAKYALSLGIDKALLIGKGEETSGGRRKPSLLADAVEALVCALYLDGGLENAKTFVLHYLGSQGECLNGEVPVDPKTRLQEYLQGNAKGQADYCVISEWGPDHEKTFSVEVRVGGKTLGRGTGRKKREAEQQAAHEALSHLKVD